MIELRPPVAVSRTYPAGARLIREDDPADYVIVILSGQTALYVSAWSASVIALEKVRALVMRAADFAAFISRPAHKAAPPPVPGHRWPARQYPQLLDGENCTVILSDVAGFGSRDRTDDDRRMIREALFSMTHGALQGLPDVWSWDDRGDGVLTVIPPSVPTAKVIQHLHRELPAILGHYNGAESNMAAWMRLFDPAAGPTAIAGAARGGPGFL